MLAQLGFGPVPGRLQLDPRVSPPERYARVFGKEVRPVECLQLGDRLVLVLDPTARAVPAADSRDLRGEEMVGRAQSRSLECAFGRETIRQRLSAVRSAPK